MSKPVAGERMIFFSVLVILGINTPFVVLVISSIALASAALPVVLTLKDWETAVKCRVVANANSMCRGLGIKGNCRFFNDWHGVA